MQTQFSQPKERIPAKQTLCQEELSLDESVVPFQSKSLPEEKDKAAREFLSGLYRNCDQGFIEFRYLPACKRTFIPLSEIKALPSFPPDQNIYFGVGTRDGKGGTKDNIVQIPAFWIDVDFKKIRRDEGERRLQQFQLTPSAVVETGGGYHIYWFLDSPLGKDDISKVESILKRLAMFFNADRAATDASRILRVPGTLNLKYDPPFEVILKKLDPDLRYSISDFDILSKTIQNEPSPPRQFLSKGWQDGLLAGVSEGERNDTATKLAGRWLTKGHSEKEVFDILSVWNQRNFPPLSTLELETIVKSVARTHARNHPMASAGGGKTYSSIRLINDDRWPEPLVRQAFHGLAGEFVHLVGPHTEADPAALLIQFLAAVGNVIGTGSFFRVEADTHYLKLFAVLVGQTSKARKGTSWGIVKNRSGEIDPEWNTKRVMSGLSSGEGLIWQVRNEIRQSQPIREGGRVTGYQEVIVDPGENDKRLMVTESEFASLLKVMGREGNTLSPVIRDAWDHGNLQTMTKNSPVRATGAHISIIGHITRDELRRNLDRTEAGNGFANRFIWICVRRSKALPEGGRLDKVYFDEVDAKLRQAISFGRSGGEITRDEEAREIWRTVYPSLSEGKPGLWGAVTSRAEAQVMRLAALYAILDESRLIRAEHLFAALALWDYSEASAKYIFGDSTGDPVADRILAALKRSSSGLTLSEIHELFSRHKSTGNIQGALALLERFNGVQRTSLDTGGRPTEVWQIKEEDAK